MKQLGVSALLLLAIFLSSTAAEESEYKTSDWTKTLRNIKDGVQKLRTYYTSYKYVKYIKPALDLSSGSDGLCRNKCSDGVHKPNPRPRYKPSLPDGCSAPVFGFYFNIGMPSMTECCNQHDRCYDTCGKEKHDCDDQFHTCLETICRNVQITLGVKQTAQGQMLFPRPGHNPSSNGCGTPLFGFHFDIGIPAITRCCNQHDHCYDTCGRKKLECDEQFQVCLKNICGNLLKALGLDRKEACDSLVSQVFDGVMHLGCKVYLDSQKAACVCKDKAEL